MRWVLARLSDGRTVLAQDLRPIPSKSGCLPMIVIVIALIMGIRWLYFNIYDRVHNDEMNTKENEQMAWAACKETIAYQTGINDLIYNTNNFESINFNPKEAETFADGYKQIYNGEGTYTFTSGFSKFNDQVHPFGYRERISFPLVDFKCRAKQQSDGTYVINQVIEYKGFYDDDLEQLESQRNYFADYLVKLQGDYQRAPDKESVQQYINIVTDLVATSDQYLNALKFLPKD